MQLPPFTPKNTHSVLTSGEGNLTLIMTPKKKKEPGYDLVIHSLQRLHRYMDTEDYRQVGLSDHLPKLSALHMPNLLSPCTTVTIMFLVHSFIPLLLLFQAICVVNLLAKVGVDKHADQVFQFVVASCGTIATYRHIGHPNVPAGGAGGHLAAHEAPNPLLTLVRRAQILEVLLLVLVLSSF